MGTLGALNEVPASTSVECLLKAIVLNTRRVAAHSNGPTALALKAGGLALGKID
jgi:hypothetical protein